MRYHRALFHVDAVQWAAHLSIDVDAWQADLVSLSGHKLGGPKGVGALFVRRGTQLLPAPGRSQERQRRAGTEDVPAIVGFGVAFALVHASPPSVRPSMPASSISPAVFARPSTDVPGLAWTGDPRARLPGTVSAVIDGVEGGDLVAALDLEGVEISTGSACTSGSTEPSHVLLAMGIEPHVAHGSSGSPPAPRPRATRSTARRRSCPAIVCAPPGRRPGSGGERVSGRIVAAMSGGVDSRRGGRAACRRAA